MDVIQASISTRPVTVPQHEEIVWEWLPSVTGTLLVDATFCNVCCDGFGFCVDVDTGATVCGCVTLTFCCVDQVLQLLSLCVLICRFWKRLIHGLRRVVCTKQKKVLLK